MKIVVGLGNPGKEYRDMRHNVGFKVIERLACLIHAEFCKKGHLSLYGCMAVGKEEVILAKPTTYINRSGVAVNSFLHHYNIQSENLLIIYDDADLELGRIHIRCQGGAGGHRGIESIIHCLGTKNFQRLRIGVKGKGRGKVLTEYVLTEFTPDEQPTVEEMIVKGAEAAEFILRKGVKAAMNKYNLRAPVHQNTSHQLGVRSQKPEGNQETRSTKYKARNRLKVVLSEAKELVKFTDG